MLLQQDKQTEGAYPFCRSQRFAWGRCLQKGRNKIPGPTPALLPASEVKGKLGRPGSALPAEGEFGREGRGSLALHG